MPTVNQANATGKRPIVAATDDPLRARYVRRFGEAAFVARLQERMAKAGITLRLP